MKIICIPVGPIQSNVYIYYDENTMEAILIDCGDEAEKIIAALQLNNLKLKAILLTHGHYDHIRACDKVEEFANVPIYAGKNEVPLLKDSYLNASSVMGRVPIELDVDNTFDDGDVFEFSSHSIKVLFTPGHTFGSVCFYNEKDKHLFTGDTLFFRDVGRTDLKTGNYEQIIQSLTKIILQLPEDVVVYPGHGQTTSIGYEKENNLYGKI